MFCKSMELEASEGRYWLSGPYGTSNFDHQTLIRSTLNYTNLQSHYDNGIFGNVYLLALDDVRGKHCRHPVAVMGVVDHLA